MRAAGRFARRGRRAAAAPLLDVQTVLLTTSEVYSFAYQSAASPSVFDALVASLLDSLEAQARALYFIPCTLYHLLPLFGTHDDLRGHERGCTEEGLGDGASPPLLHDLAGTKLQDQVTTMCNI